MSKRVTIVGGGISGLSASYYLQKKHPDWEIHLLESSSRLGGKIITEQRDGFLIEGGPDSFLAQKPWARLLAEELGLSDELLPCNADKQKVFILRNGILLPLPQGFRLAVATQLLPLLKSPLLSTRSKIRLAAERFVPRENTEEDMSLARFLRKRLGNEAANQIAGPLLSGIYSANPERLSVQAAFPLFPKMLEKYGSLTAAMITKQNKTGGSPPPMFISFKEGMQSFVNGLVPKLKAKIHLHTEVKKITRFKEEFIVGEHKADRLVLALPSYISAQLLKDIHPELSEKLNAIRYNSTANVNLAFKKDDWPGEIKHNGFGFIAPSSESCSIQACTRCSTKFNFRAPESFVVLRAFLGGERNPEVLRLSDDALVALVLKDFRKILGLEAEPVLSRVFRWNHANPQYDVGHLERINDIEKLTSKIPGLYLIGNAYRGVSVPDLIHQAQNLDCTE